MTSDVNAWLKRAFTLSLPLVVLEANVLPPAAREALLHGLLAPAKGLAADVTVYFSSSAGRQPYLALRSGTQGDLPTRDAL